VPATYHRGPRSATAARMPPAPPAAHGAGNPALRRAPAARCSRVQALQPAVQRPDPAASPSVRGKYWSCWPGPRPPGRSPAVSASHRRRRATTSNGSTRRSARGRGGPVRGPTRPAADARTARPAAL